MRQVTAGRFLHSVNQFLTDDAFLLSFILLMGDMGLEFHLSLYGADALLATTLNCKIHAMYIYCINIFLYRKNSASYFSGLMRHGPLSVSTG